MQRPFCRIGRLPKRPRTRGADGGALGACLPIIEYNREFRARAADELATRPDGSTIAEMLSDYAVLRDQARSC
jgi:hypothetical protein